MKTSTKGHRFQNLRHVIQYSRSEKVFITSLIPFQSVDWDKSLKKTGRPRGAQANRDRLKDSIKRKLSVIQYPHCIYCGIHTELVGNLQRDHIAPKEIYLEFIFEAENLVLACAGCNGFIKKNNFDTISRYNKNDYTKCTFKIIHPYRDRFQDHLDFDENLFVKPKKYSRKGKLNISLFELDGVMQTMHRSAALIKRALDGKLTPAQKALCNKIRMKEYGF